ncbi:MAG: hypothetical protein ER33_06870 [Cyanobium sp. CACIAM 14]|nr:MAG: hypothetical protein ER33_06870 [Cyanobium sp. CACIAM 14]
MGFFSFSRSNFMAISRGSGATQQRLRSLKPRQEQRSTVPIFSIKIRAEFFLKGRRYVGNLWDVSRWGACVCSFEPLPSSGRIRVCLHDHASDDMVERMATLLWSDHAMNAYYVGFCFDEPLGEDCGFLCNLLNIPDSSLTSRLSSIGPIRLNPWPV